MDTTGTSPAFGLGATDDELGALMGDVASMLRTVLLMNPSRDQRFELLHVLQDLHGTVLFHRELLRSSDARSPGQ